MIRKKLFFLVLLGFIYGQAQENKPQTEEVLDDLFDLDSTDPEEIFDSLKTDFLYFNVGFDEQAYFSGRDFGIEQYSVQPSLTYMRGNHLFFNLGSAYYSGLNPNWDIVSISAGYFSHLDKKRKWNTSFLYGRMFFTDQSEELNQNRLSASVSYSVQSLKFRLSSGYLFGGNSSYFLSPSTTWRLNLVENKKWALKFSPVLRFLWSQQLSTEEITSGRFSQIITTIEQEIFALVNVQIELPLSFDVGRWDLNLSYQFNLPKALQSEEELSNNGFVRLNIGYLIDF